MYACMCVSATETSIHRRSISLRGNLRGKVKLKFFRVLILLSADSTVVDAFSGRNYEKYAVESIKRNGKRFSEWMSLEGAAGNNIDTYVSFLFLFIICNGIKVPQ